MELKYDFAPNSAQCNHIHISFMQCDLITRDKVLNVNHTLRKCYSVFHTTHSLCKNLITEEHLQDASYYEVITWRISNT